MKLDELRPNLLEILDTEPVGIKWRQSGNQHRGTFTLDGETITVEVDEYEAAGTELVDVGFTVNGSIQFTGSNAAASRLVGAVTNAIVPKIKEIDLPFVLLSVKRETGAEASRRSAYEMLIKWAQRKLGSPYTWASDWIEGPKGWTKLIGKEAPTPDQLRALMDAAA